MKIICIGRNYADHAKELNNAVPDEPILFMKAQNALLQPGKAFYYPEISKDIHYECELVVKISKGGKHIHEKFAYKYFNEITLGIDFTARDLQQKQKEKGLPWEIAKAFDHSAAIGQFIPLGEKDIQALHFELKKNDTIVQRGDTSNMLHTIPQIIAYASRYFSLNVGDLLFTGTPAGVGPITIGDHLTGILEGQTLLELDIK